MPPLRQEPLAFRGCLLGAINFSKNSLTGELKSSLLNSKNRKKDISCIKNSEPFMPEKSKRLRILAGPNGSGKSTVVKKITSTYYCGPFVNADLIQNIFDNQRVLNLSSEFGIKATSQAFESFISNDGQSWFKKAGSEGTQITLTFSDNNLVISSNQTGKYDAAVAADFIRHELLVLNNTFTFETVLSHRSKLEFMEQANALGYKVYLYFVCTVDPEINIRRIEQRVKLGGHTVPKEKVIKRYYESLELLPLLIPATHRTFLFDNSTDDSDIQTIGEIENGYTFRPQTDEFPWWVVDHVLSPLF
jgi:predicted ABC-type ATPase